ncbi:MAG: GntR family transcriptional regulator [Planctomycetota bacterium]
MLTVRLDSDEPLIDQLVRELRAAIASGNLAPGAELPPVRQLAGDLGINLNTVARAYRALQQSGLVHTARGRGTRVIAARESRSEPKRATRKRLGYGVRTFLTDAKLAGLDRAAVEAILIRQVESLWPGSRPLES